MGGEGSGRRSVKAQAIYCMMDVQLQLQKIKFEGIHGNKTFQQIEPMIDDAIQICKRKQEEVERL